MKICSLASSVPYKKNPFLGPELVCFANPNNPGEGQGESKDGFVEVASALKNVVPGKIGKLEDLLERHEHWVTLLGDYNHTQVNINDLQETLKKLRDPKLLEGPDYQERIRAHLNQEYKKMAQILGTLPNVENTLADTIQANVKNQYNADRLGAISVADRLVAALIKQRKVQLKEVSETLRKDLAERIAHLRKGWVEKCPPAYVEEQGDWIAYCDKLKETIEGYDVSNWDDGTVNSPAGSEALKQAQVWWEKLSHMEDSYKDFCNQNPEQFSLEKAEQEFNALKQKRTTILDEKTLKLFFERSDQVLERGRETEAIINAKLAEWEGNKDRKQDSESLKASLKALQNKMKELEAKKDINNMVETAFTGTREIYKFKVPNEGGELSIPEGIEGQIAALKKMPLSTPGRKQAIRTLMEGMKAIEDNMNSLKLAGEVTLPTAMDDLRNFQMGIDTRGSGQKRELMLVNPFATMGHLWHSYTETIKSNFETTEKRGAGYFQRDATKIFTKMPKIPLVGSTAVVKSLTELSVNGAVEAEHAEHKKVGDHEKAYEGVPPDHLLHIASEASDQWELQGCLKVLAKHGRIDWYAPWLFEQLNKYQKHVEIPLDKQWHQRNITKSGELLRQAFVYIYRDEDVYRNLRNSNLSSYESKMGEYNKQWGGIAAEHGALERRAEEILDLYESDHHNHIHFSKANPIEFESIIRYGVEWGKMKMEARLRLLVRGIAIGLLPFDRGVNATDKNNNYPPYDYFDTGTGRSGRPTYDDVCEWNVYAKDPATWDYFMHSHKGFGVMNNKMVNERLIKTMSQGSHRLDHDDAPGIAGYFRMDTTKDLLKVKTQGGYGMPVTGLLSMTTGNEMWLRMFAEEYNDMDPQKRKDELVRFCSQFMMMEGIMNDRVFKQGAQDYYRLKSGPDRTEPPRNARSSYMEVAKEGKKPTKLFQIDDDRYKTANNGKAYNTDAGPAEILAYVANKLQMLDFTRPALVHMLIHNQIKTDPEAKKFCAELEYQTGMFDGNPPTTIDELYANLPKYFEYAIGQNSENVQKLVDSVRSEHKNPISTMDHHLAHDLQHVRDAANVRAVTGKEPAHHDDGGGGGDHGAHGGGGEGGEHPHEGDAHPHEGEHPQEGHDGAVHGSTPVGGGPTAQGSTHPAGGNGGGNGGGHGGGH